jgi:hypothetical protein
MCALTNKLVLSDEVGRSDITGKIITSTLLKTSALSGKRAEPEFFDKCEFTSSEVLKNELKISEVSQKHYRIDEQASSVISRKLGHQQEFIICSETNQLLLAVEAERCDITGKIVMPGLLESCEVSGKKVLASELEKSAATGKKALKKFFVSSSLSSARILEEEAIRSIEGKFCAPLEARMCFWNGRQYHPDDLRTCQLTGVMLFLACLEPHGKSNSEVLIGLLNGVRRKSDKPGLWNTIITYVSNSVGKGNYKIESAELSPDGQRLAVCLKVKKWIGLKVRHIGLFYSIPDNAIIGKIAFGKRSTSGWVAEL